MAVSISLRKAIPRPGVVAVCIDNADYPASLEPRKLYEIVPDDRADSHRQLRVIDESGEDYLYPARYFRLVRLPRSLERVLRRPRGHVVTKRRATGPARIRPA